MKKMNMIKTVSLTAAVAAAVGSAIAADATVGVDFASAYVFRGATFNDEPVMQPYLEVAGLEIAGKAITLGTWANYDFTSGYTDGESGEFTEIDYYASIDLGAGFGLGYTQYTYPTVEGDSDKEIGLSYGTEMGGVELSLAGYYMVGGAYQGSLYVEAGAGYGIEISEALSGSLGATVGYLAMNEEDGVDGLDEGFSNYTLSAGLAYALSESTELSASVTYIGEMDDDVLETDVEVVGVVGLAYNF